MPATVPLLNIDFCNKLSLITVPNFINNCPTRCNTKQFIILQVHSTCFGYQPHPSSGVYKTVTTASGTGHIFCAATSL